MLQQKLPRQRAREAGMGSRRSVMQSPAGAGAAPPGLLINVSRRAGRVRVTLRGEIDLSAKAALEAALQDALSRSTHGVDLDLSGTTFCDCAGLNCFLAARHRALAAGKTVTIQAASPLVQRLLSVTATWPLFTLERPDSTRPAGAPTPPAAAHEEDVLDGDEDLRIEVDQLRRAMQTRPVIDQATGILMASFSLSAQDAWQVLVVASQNTNTKLAVVAEELRATVQGRPLSEAVQEQVRAAVASLHAGHAPSDEVQLQQSVQKDCQDGRAMPAPDEA
ncbi:ANTAR domain-containing protein [Streptomyces sp. NPDC101151]|uniref:ANTAR domain-containing protein n=1 Tax=Streptomyces sp. NPDC101151 TaxID=3366115 RepID=UPI003818BC27